MSILHTTPTILKCRRVLTAASTVKATVPLTYCAKNVATRFKPLDTNRIAE